jgi:hypothetical protein
MPIAYARPARSCAPRGARLLAFACLPLGLLALPSSAHAQTDEIQVYDAEITPPGQWNLTWHNNFTPQGRRLPDFPGGVVPDHTLNGVPEWAYGVTDWFEAGAYVPIYSYTSSGQLLFEGVKLRTLFVVPHAAERKFFYGVNFEYSYNRPTWDTHHFSGEIRPIVGTHLGPWDLIVNPAVDTEYNGFRNITFEPEARVAYNFSPKFALAAEYYADFGPVPIFLAPPEQSQQLFAVVDIGTSSHGIEFGVGHGFTPGTDTTVIKLMLMQDF